MFHAAMSASVTGLPRPGVSASAAPAPKPSPSATASSDLCIDMLDPSLAVDAPAGDAVVVLVGEGEGARQRLLGLPARRDELGAQRLHVATFVPRAALQDHRLAVPAPRHAETGERLGIYRRLQRRLSPAFPAVGRDHDLGDAAVARIGDAGNLVEAGPFERMAEGRMRDE